MSIRTKLLGSVILLFLVLVLALVGASAYQITSNSMQNTMDSVKVSGEGIVKIMDSYRNDVLSAGRAMATMPSLRDAVLTNNKEKVRQVTASYAKEVGVDVVIAINANGVVVARMHDEKAGDNISDRKEVRDALSGKDSTSLDSNAITKLSIRSTVPMKDENGKIIGALICGTNVLKPWLVDKVKEFYGTECTIFIGDTREMTTLMQNGQRAVGTKASPEIVEKVLKQGQTHIGEANVLGQQFITMYTPLMVDASQKPVGMYFAGRSMAGDIAKRNASLYTNVGISAVLLLIVAAIIAFIISKITRPIPIIAAAAQSMATGDLRQTIDVKSKDELGILAVQFNEMTGMLRTLIGQITESANVLAASSEELNASASEAGHSVEQVTHSISGLASGADSQVELVTQAKNTMDGMTKRMAETVNTAQTIYQLAESAVGATDKGRQAVDHAVKQMSNIVTDTQKVQEAIGKLSGSAIEINKIIEVISAIAGQTNLLALNAAIEAARAGEQGRGFAVVAEEVRKLAEESEKAAISIKGLLSANQSDIEEAVVAMDSSAAGVKDGIEVVAAAGETFKDIAGAIHEVSAKTEGIVKEVKGLEEESDKVAASASGVYAVSRQAAEQAEKVLSMTEEQTATVQEIAAASRSLAVLAQELTEKVHVFKF